MQSELVLDFRFRLPQFIRGIIIKRMRVIEELVGMDILCGDKMGTITLNKLNMDKFLIYFGDY